MPRSFSGSVPKPHSTRPIAKPAGWARSIGSHGRSKTQHRAIRCEPLEDRRMLWVGAGGENVLELFSTQAALFVENQGETRFNHFVGDHTKWASDVPGYKVVAYKDLYDGIDLHTFGRRDLPKD
jgi:hypothetical protein